MVYNFRIFISFFCILLVAVASQVVFFNKNSIGAREKGTVGDVLRKIEQKHVQQVKKKKNALPKFNKIKILNKVNLRKVKPPSSSQFYYGENANEIALEKATDRLIKDAYQLTQRFKRSRGRGELWLRLAELYVEKARLIEFRLQDDYDKRIQEYYDKKRKRMPRLDLSSAMTYNRKAIQLYEWFLRDYPKDSKGDQALFLLGYNYFELNQPRKGKGYYLRLTKEYPKSLFVHESNFSLGEYYFNNEKWREALKHYKKIIRDKKARLYSFSLYKSAWCQYKMGQAAVALRSMEKVIYTGRKAKGRSEKSKVSRIRLATEAVKDIVAFYVEAGNYKSAYSYFQKVVGRKSAPKLLAKIAFYYVDAGNLPAAKYSFRKLISLNSNSPRAYEYQYQIVKIELDSGNNRVFIAELFKWINGYNKKSEWFSKNAKNKNIIAKSNKLVESTLRSYILQTHQTAQKSKVADTQKQASDAYNAYFRSFTNSENVDEMHFFYGELLYDMKNFEQSAKHYEWVFNYRSKSKYAEKAILNAILSREKLLPTPKEIKSIVGGSLKPIPFGPKVKAFEKVAIKYLGSKHEDKSSRISIRYRIGSLYYYYNQFDLAIEHLMEVAQKAPKTKYGEYSVNFILDIFNIKKDYKNLGVVADKLLGIYSIGSSKLGSKVREIKQKATFKQAEEKEKLKDYKNAAKDYASFATANPRSSLAIGARFNAAVNFERAGMLLSAISMYHLVLTMKGNKEKVLKPKAQKFLASIYEQTGQYLKAANIYEVYSKKNPKSKVAIDFLYNAAVIQDGLDRYSSALKNYQSYYDKSREKDRSEVLFLMGKIWERRKKASKAISFYKKYIKESDQSGKLFIEASYKIGHIYEKEKNKSKAHFWYKKTVSLHKEASGEQRDLGLRYAAEAKFNIVYETYLALQAISIPAGKRQSAAVQKKLKMMNQLKEQLKSVVAYNDGSQVVAALTVQGQALQHMASSIYHAPVPKELKGDDLKLYKKEIDKLAKPFQEQAIGSYKSAIEKAFRFQAYNKWLNIATIELGKVEPGKNSGHDYETHLTRLTDGLGGSRGSSEKSERPKGVSGSYRRLKLALNAKDEDMVVKEVSKMLSVNPKDLNALNALGYFYFTEGKSKMAKIIYQRALKNHEKEPGLYNNIGVIYLVEGDIRKAIFYFKRAIEIKDSYENASLNLGSIFSTYKDYGRALAPLESGYEKMKSGLGRRNESAIGVSNNYAVALMGTGQNKQAEKIFKKALDSGVRDASLLYNYAILLIDILKERGDAYRILSKVKFNTNNPNLLRKVSELEKRLGEL